MRTFATVFLASIASALAYQVTSPGGAQGWTTSGPNVLKWQRVDTDPLNFTAVLTNVNQGVMPLGDQVLNALVDGTQGQIICNPPSGGWPTGDGFRVNLAHDVQNLDTLLAQSTQFSITAPSSSSGATSSSNSPTMSTPAGTTSTYNVGSTTSSDTSTTPTGKTGAALGMSVHTGFLAGITALAAFALENARF